MMEFIRKSRSSGYSFKMEVNESADIYEMAEALHLFLLGCGYQPDTIKKILILEDE